MKLSRELKTGIIVIGGILLFILGFSYLKATPLFDNSKTFYAVYDDVGGLQPGTQVSINGFSVGKVNDIRFKDKTGKLMVTFTVDSDFQFSKNSIAELYDTGIIGGKGIQIIPVFDNAKMAESGDTLVTKTKPGLTDLVQQNLAPLQTKVEGAISNADSLLINVNDVLDAKTKKDLQNSIAGLNDLIKSFKVTTNSLNSIMANNKDEIEGSMANIKKITDDFAKISSSLSEAELDKSIAGLQKTVTNLDNLLTKIDKGEGSLGKLMNNEELYNNLAGASKELDLLLQDFRLNPKRYVNVSVFGKKQKEYTLPENDPADTLKTK